MFLKCALIPWRNPSIIINSAFQTLNHRCENKLYSSTWNSRNNSQHTFPDFSVRRKKKEIGPFGIFLLLIPIGTFGLGTWQVKRKKWKEDLIENLMVKTKAPPIDLPLDDDEVKELEYRRVRVRGKFDHSGEIFLGPRSLLVDGESKGNAGKLLSASGTSGFNVITPFTLSETGERILVNRGWVEYPKKKASLRAEGQVRGEVVVEGVVRLTEKRAPFTPDRKADARIWFMRDVEGMAAFVGARPVFVDASFASTVPGGPVGGQTRAALRNEHFSYIVTWYSLSAATAFLWYAKFIK